MAYANIYMKNPSTGAIKEAPVGFSWTNFFFGFFVPCFRAHWGMAVIQIALAIVTFGISNFVFPFIYNKIYINYLLGEGFKVTSATQDVALLATSLQRELPILESA